MIVIQKSKPPRLLQEAFLKKSYSYRDFRDKDNIKQFLLKEQGYLCAYCMGRIDTDNMKIEHWYPQSKDKCLELDYANMLGVCKGREGYPEKEQHCDTKKGDELLKYNPSGASEDLLQIKYSKDGTISSVDGEFNEQLNTILNLNIKYLKRNREAALEGFFESLKRKHLGDGSLIMKYIKKISSANQEGKKTSYCGIILFFLNKKLNKS